ncbi:MAG TPA: ABC transporter permease [Anaerolineales bacterium]|nr:ABC transporter permease [Anaerolineales bacterium]
MKFLDLIRLIFGNLSRRKARVALTAIGVVIGTAAVVILVSLAIGLQKNANEQLYGIGDLTQIHVMPAYDMEGPVMRGGGGGGGVVVTNSGNAQGPRLLTNSALDEIRALPGVASVIPHDYLMTGMLVKYQKLEGGGNVMGVGTKDLADLGLEATQGATELVRGGVVVGPMVSAQLYNPRQRPGEEPPPPPDLYGQQIQLVVLKWDEQGAEIRKNLSVRVTGVLKETGGESDWTMYFPIEQIKSLNEWSQGIRINYNKDGYSQVIVKAQEVDKVMDISQQITDMGFQAYTAQSFVQGINNFYVILQFIFGGVGAIALLVAAIGIANTMAMSILERTREIGLMKAVGATNRDVLTIFLGEAAGIGFIGGLGGTLIGWLLGQGINVIAIVYLANQAGQQGGAPPSVAVYTPVWLPAFALIFATIIGMISGLYPALRAATMIPVIALKYE